MIIPFGKEWPARPVALGEALAMGAQPAGQLPEPAAPQRAPLLRRPGGPAGGVSGGEGIAGHAGFGGVSGTDVANRAAGGMSGGAGFAGDRGSGGASGSADPTG